MVKSYLELSKRLLSETKSSFEINELLSGFSGQKLIELLSESVKLYEDVKEVCYVEIGVFQGLTLLSVADSNRGINCYGIDNFAFFDKERKNQKIIEERRSKLNIENVNLINLDYEDALENLGAHIGNKKIGVFFIDGPHDYRSQLMCLQLAKPYLADNAIIIIDDSNYEHVRQANCDFLKTHSDYKLLFEAYEKAHPANLSENDEYIARQNWWNGINVIVKDPANELKAIFPQTRRNRDWYLDQHILMASPVVNNLDRLNQLGVFLRNKQLLKWLKHSIKLFLKLGRDKSRLFDSMNTYCDTLEVQNIAERNKKLK